MEGTLVAMLENSMDPSSSHFVESQKMLEHLKEVNLPEFIRALSDVIVDQNASLNSRHLAGILMKNCFECNGKASEEQKARFFQQVTPETLQYIKHKMLNVMKVGSETQPMLAACTVVSRIAEIELSRNTWPDFFDIILSMANSNDISQCSSSLTCLSYLIEDLSTVYENQNVSILSKVDCDRILTSVIKCVYMDAVQPCKMALQVLQNLFIFIRSNMEVTAERDVIVEAICRRCATGNDTDVRTTAYDCLVQLVTEYYSLIAPCLQVIVPFLWQAIDSEEEEFAIPAFEFWNTICETEIGMEIDNDSRNQHIIRQVIPFLLPKILHTMTLHTYEELDNDTWTLPMAAGICLSLCAQTVKNDIVYAVLTFVEQNFQRKEWNCREAAVLAYGYIMDGPDSENLKELVERSFGQLCDILKDPSIAVRDTAAWTIGRIASFHSETIISHLGSLNDPNSNISKITEALFQPPRVAVNICWFIHELSESYSGDRTSQKIDEYIDSIFVRICDKLVQRGNMDDSTERNLFSSIYSAISSLISAVGASFTGELHTMLNYFEDTLGKLVSTDISSHESRVRQDVLCGVIQVLITRLRTVSNIQRLWNNLFQILTVDFSEEVLLTISTIVNSISPEKFAGVLPNLVETIIAGLKRPDHVSSCKICIELTSDISHVMEDSIRMYAPHILQLLFNILNDMNADKTLTAPIVTALGDIAMAIGGEFAPHIQPAMVLLMTAASTEFEMGPSDSEEWIYFVNDLREGVLQAFTGIVYGLKTGNKLDHIKSYVPTMLTFAQRVIDTQDNYFSAMNYKLAVALVGDLVNAFGSDLSRHIADLPLVKRISYRLEQLESRNDPAAVDCREKVTWLFSILNR
ncbi:importin beta-1, putative [Theileria equi strain WA]|uniref:Importin beta-1, putative n=1 Tax=Theileria equi strain WA TaxID=1537102 RepID=L0AYA5_THEEQ|nr:importin beta-1, putative [Theileria equi strain WA]AFZ80545.1 importin beta-1, putative [Theileria equi strain WA]|eukprot:XP_004830211.1 importin beta-1, putative [Theileria equi strain WA]